GPEGGLRPPATHRPPDHRGLLPRGAAELRLLLAALDRAGHPVRALALADVVPELGVASRSFEARLLRKLAPQEPRHSTRSLRCGGRPRPEPRRAVTPGP